MCSTSFYYSKIHMEDVYSRLKFFEGSSITKREEWNNGICENNQCFETIFSSSNICHFPLSLITSCFENYYVRELF